MQPDYTVQVLEVSHYPVANVSTGAFTNNTRVRIKVGDFGPFQKDFPPGADQAEHITAWKQERVQYVQAITAG